jgi:hypothetical protein
MNAYVLALGDYLLDLDALIAREDLSDTPNTPFIIGLEAARDALKVKLRAFGLDLDADYEATLREAGTPQPRPLD